MLPAWQTRGPLTRPLPFLFVLAVDHADALDDDLGQRPHNLYRTVVGLDAALVLAVHEFAFDEDMVAFLDVGHVIGCESVSDAGMPTCFLGPSAIRILVALRCRNGQPRHALAL